MLWFSQTDQSLRGRHILVGQYLTYQSWFTVPELNHQLGPMDEAWLEHLFTDTAGIEL